jgi:hypothetical protein
MSKSPGSLWSCPNPNRSSKVHKVFLSEANINKHFGAKPACYKFARQYVHSALVDQKILSFSTDTTTSNQATHQNVAQQVVPEAELDLNAPDFPLTDYTDNLGDYEDHGFYHLELDDMDYHGYVSTLDVCL